MSFEFQNEYDLLIGGEWVKAEKGATFETYNPATDELLAKCANASAKDVVDFRLVLKGEAEVNRI